VNRKEPLDKAFLDIGALHNGTIDTKRGKTHFSLSLVFCPNGSNISTCTVVMAFHLFIRACSVLGC
jgi:hypothetical protein